ncbi:MAG: hypothetical protein GY711_02170, partial [bacterium]|nr:hypothetical protein [bacterium]
MWTVLLASLALLQDPAAPRVVTFPTADGLTISADYYDAGKDASTVICLPMLRNVRASGVIHSCAAFWSARTRPLLRCASSETCSEVASSLRLAANAY